MSSRIPAIQEKIVAILGDGLVRQLVSGSIWSLLIKVANAGLTYIMLVLIARSMDTAEFGRFGFGFNLGTFLAVVASAGLHTAVLRWIPEYEAQGRPDDARRALRWSITMTFASALILTSIVAIVVAILPDIETTGFIYAGLCLVLPVVFAELLASALRTKGSIIWAQLPRDILWRLGGIGLAGISIVQMRPYSAAEFLLWLVAILTLLLAPQIMMLWRDLAAKDEKLWPSKSLSKDWISQLGPYWGTAVIYASTQYVDVILVGTFMSPQDAGAYFAASRTAGLCALMLIASNMVSAPLISGAFHSGDMTKLQRILKIVSVCISIPTVVIVIALIAAGEPLLSLFDPTFVSAYWALAILAFAHGINGLCGPMSYVLQLTGHGRNNLIIMGGSYAVGILAQILLIPRFGLIGAAWGSGGTIILWNLLNWVYCRRQLGVDPTIIALVRTSSISRV